MGNHPFVGFPQINYLLDVKELIHHFIERVQVTQIGILYKKIKIVVPQNTGFNTQRGDLLLRFK